MAEKSYVLGTGDAEITRLGLQHSLWRAAAHALWDDAGFQPGQRLLDVGAGPGYATFDLAARVGPRGHVTAVDQSERFLEVLRGRAGALGVEHVDAVSADVQDLAFPPESFDGAYARWVLCFVRDPDAVLAGVARCLRPGGRFAVQDYLNYGAMRLAPPSATFARVVDVVVESWRSAGGDPEIGCRLPALAEKHGFRTILLRPVSRTARPSDPLWQWPSTFFAYYVGELVGRGLLSEADRAAWQEDWRAHETMAGAFFSIPLVFDLVLEKRG